jgi:hypothetical protein
MEALRDLLLFMLVFAVVAFSFWIRYRRPANPKVEVQTLFHGNTKDDDQI